MIEEVQEDAAIAVSECTRKAMEVSTKNEAETKSSPVDEEVNRDQESKGTEGTTSTGDIMRLRWKESLSCVNILKKLGKSRVPRESTHRRRKEEKWYVWNPQRRRITHQNRQRGVELHPECSQRAAMGPAHVRPNAVKKVPSSTNLRPL